MTVRNAISGCNHYFPVRLFHTAFLHAELIYSGDASIGSVAAFWTLFGILSNALFESSPSVFKKNQVICEIYKTEFFDLLGGFSILPL